jgi:hypothetical protein
MTKDEMITWLEAATVFLGTKEDRERLKEVLRFVKVAPDRRGHMVWEDGDVRVVTRWPTDQELLEATDRDNLHMARLALTGTRLEGDPPFNSDQWFEADTSKRLRLLKEWRETIEYREASRGS